MIRARNHTAAMVRFWFQTGISAVDLALHRHDGTMIWQRDCSAQQLPLPWLRAENMRHAEIYIRPARHHAWPMVFLDDVNDELALRVAQKYAVLVVQTSPAGGCHLWLRLNQALDEPKRYLAQRWLIPKLNADIGSVSGEHLGRLAGMRNWKRAGVWVNVLNPDPPPRPAWDPTSALSQITAPPGRKTPPSQIPQNGVDHSESAKEWGWVCGALDAGIDPETVYRQLLERASQRRGRDAQRYARHTLRRALQRHT